MHIEPVAWHTISCNECIERLETSLDAGLSAPEALRRLRQFGANELTEKSARAKVLKRLARQFHNILLYVLIGSAIIAAALRHWVDAGVIAAVVVLNATIGFVQEGKAENALDAVRKMVSLQATAVRDAMPREIAASELVPGDIVHLMPGDHVPADLRLLRVTNLHIDESALTGESTPAAKNVDPLDADAAVGDQRCMAFSGTIVTRGKATGVVVSTGQRTELGRIGRLLESVEHGSTPLMRQLSVLGRVVTAFVIVIAVLVVLIGYFATDLPLDEAFLAAVGVAVAAIPEGLPLITTVSLAIGVRRMAARHALVRRLPAIETLGSVTVICSDKTGTLTRNEMTVQQVRCASTQFDIAGTGYAPLLAGDAITVAGTGVGRLPPALNALLDIAVLCNDATLTCDAQDVWHAAGDPTEASLLTLSFKACVIPDELRTRRPRLAEIPFDAAHRFMATLHASADGTHSVALLKGAPERILSMCVDQLALNGPTQRLRLNRWRRAVERSGRSGFRVLAFAQRTLPRGQRTLALADVERGLTFVGIVSLMDPPRAEAIEAIEQCRGAGVRVVMITGDHGVTAAAIAAQLGIANTDEVLIGRDVELLNDDELQRAAARVDVFARASPEHKLRLVRALQSNGDVVAMTGDGVNDAPALKQANVGVAMGLKGTDVARQASTIVLADDNFASIASAVEEGRAAYGKVSKAIVFMLPVNLAEALSILVAVVASLPLPISAVQILWINMIDSVCMALGLAFDPTDRGVMLRAPRPPARRLLTWFVVWRIVFVATLMLCGVFGLYEWALLNGASHERASTVAANTLVSIEAFYLLSVRQIHASVIHFTRGQLWRSCIAIGLAYLLQALFTFAPFMQSLFHTRDIGGWEILQIAVVSIASLALIELEKCIVRLVKRVRRQRRRGKQAD